MQFPMPVGTGGRIRIVLTLPPVHQCGVRRNGDHNGKNLVGITPVAFFITRVLVLGEAHVHGHGDAAVGILHHPVPRRLTQVDAVFEVGVAGLDADPAPPHVIRDGIPPGKIIPVGLQVDNPEQTRAQLGTNPRFHQAVVELDDIDRNFIGAV